MKLIEHQPLPLHSGNWAATRKQHVTICSENDPFHYSENRQFHQVCGRRQYGGGQKHIHISFCFVWERSELTNGANLATLSSLSSICLVGGSCIIVVGRSSPKIRGRRLVQIVYCFSCSSQNGTKCSQQLPALFDEDGAMWLVGGCPGVVFLCCVGAAVGTYSSRCNHVPAVKVPAVRGWLIFYDCCSWASSLAPRCKPRPHCIGHL
jgi:hypothetical protein